MVSKSSGAARFSYKKWEKTAALIQAQYGRLMPAMYFASVGMIFLILASAVAVLPGKPVLPRWIHPAVVCYLFWHGIAISMKSAVKAIIRAKLRPT